MTELPDKSYKSILPHLDKRLKIRLYLYIVVSVILVCVVIYDVIEDQVEFGLPILGGLVGILIGFLFSRIYKISWDHGAQKVISNYDAYGIIMLVIYIFFDVYRERLVEYFVHGPVVVATSFAVLTGIMVGRVLGIRRRVIRKIEENL